MDPLTKKAIFLIVACITAIIAVMQLLDPARQGDETASGLIALIIIVVSALFAAMWPRHGYR
jgi:hypothetical protein